MAAPYGHMTVAERLACLAAALVAVVCLAVVVTTPLGGIHAVAVVVGPAMAVVVGLLSLRSQRRRS